jgi:eukaryotic-like serine/threonine-protein kinase
VEDRTIIQLGSPGSVKRGARLNGMYEIETLIAQGGMGEVYKGFNIQTNDPVAIKMILPELARNPEAFALFRREASTLHNLQHEAIVRYFVFSVDPDLQRAYLAMEFVDGPSLTKRLTQGPLDAAEATILRKRVAGALDAAHRFGVIHRDISSDNVILPGNDTRRAKVIDFGIARSQRPGEGTLIGSGFAGKYNYVSPEQLGLGGGQVTAKSDVYSFGLVLAEALRGRPIDMNGTQVEIIEKRRSVPDLSDIPASLRPLLQAMLQPLPADRPDMADVAAWGENGAAQAKPPRAAARNAGGAVAGAGSERGSSIGRIAAAVAIVILIGSVGGTAYVFRDALPWNVALAPPSPSPTPAPDAPPHKLPQLPPLPDNPVKSDAPPNNANGDNPPATPDPQVVQPAPTEPHPPTADDIAKAVAEAKRQKQASLQPNAEITPPPANPGVDIPPKKAEVEQPPAPPKPPVAPPTQPPRAPQKVLTIAEATVGRDYVADLPPFNDSSGAKSLVLRAEPNPPEGLTFADLGSGLSQISGKPSKPGQYSFEIIAANSAGATAHMTTRIAIAPAAQPVAPPADPVSPPPDPVVVQPTDPQPPPVSPTDPGKPVVASLSPADQASAFLRDFDGGSCFLARPFGASDAIAIQGIGADKATFERFYKTFIHDVGVEPALTVRLIAAAECPAVDLIRAGGSEPPKIDLAGYDVGGRGKPLAGTISNLAGRRLDLLLVANDGKVYRLDSRIQPGGASATFSQQMTADAASANVLQMVLAVVSPRPLSALEGFKAAPAAEILPRLRSELAAADGALEVEFFKLVK